MPSTVRRSGRFKPRRQNARWPTCAPRRSGSSRISRPCRQPETRWSGCAISISRGSSSPWWRGSTCCRARSFRSTRSRRRSTTRSLPPTAPITSRASSTSSRGSFPETRDPLPERIDRYRAGLHHPARQARRGLPGRHRRMQAAHAGALRAAAGRELRGRVRQRQAVERLQLVQGRVPQPDPGQHRPADLHRPRDRPRLPRGLSRSPRVQRAAGKAPGA